MISLLNPILRGWANYHRPVVAKATFNRLDGLIFRAIWSWSKRRHRNKSVNWIRKRYFHSDGDRNWVFSTTVVKDDGKQATVALIRLADTPIRRHIKVKGSYNPFDPADELYGEKLHQVRMLHDMHHRKQWTWLYRSQNGLCAHCGGKITRETGWHDHHLHRRVDGGSNRLENRVLLHPVCHAKVHSQGIIVVKPDCT